MLQKGDSNTTLAVAELDSPSVHVYDVRSGSDEPIDSFQVHRAPVVVMRYNAAHNTVISIDQKGAAGPCFPVANLSCINAVILSHGKLALCVSLAFF